MESEAIFLRGLAVVALVAALVATVYISVSSGLIGGSGSSGGAQAIDSSAQAAPAAGQAGGQADASASGNLQQDAVTTTSGHTYTVQDGDSFYSIAGKYHTTISEIQKRNPNVDPQNLHSGLTLNVP